ncbi:hypothetical protein BOTBODRAFT_181652 [Botryobasidium botryosum FD-172 SS1]|uniref:Phosphate transporter n=1 Tax=Botryobasidium botryosum (strain FD-172 SS1) TaxID=930990 RepID=A0A067M482_BOTB1|nr:hypothetical protein BOTBODRAFT_181652 [Botryobasidium botryosum FD-172 SS1]
MARLTQYDYLFVWGLFFSFLDAFNIGANDVANSFATSVSSRSLTLRQAIGIATVMEFLGAVLVGARTAATIRNNIIDINIFEKDPAMLLLAMVCAITGSACWLTFATRNHMPVSTTHSIIGALCGVGVAGGGRHAVHWGWDGLGQIFASWGIAPCIAGGFASIVYLFTKYAVLKRKDSVRWGLYTSPLYFFVVSAILTMAIAWKGSPSLGLNKLSTGTTLAAIFGTAAVVTLLSILFWLPFVYCRVIRGDYTIRWYHFFLGPLLWKRQPPPDAGEHTADRAVPDYYAGHRPADHPAPGTPSEKVDPELEASHDSFEPPPPKPAPLSYNARAAEKYPIEGPWIEPKNLWIILRYRAIPFIWNLFTHGSSVDVVQMQNEGADAKRMADIHAHAAQYDNKTEHLYSFLQVLTASTASFAHGSNDVANAIGPFATIYLTWNSGTFAGSKAPVPVWILVFGGACIVLGLATYGYNMMRVLGNRLTLHSPSRGFSMELGASITVVLASQLAIPISTTQCITGATVAVGLCNGDTKALNWKMLAWIFLSWVLTVPMAGIISGCLFGIIINAPRFGAQN